MATSLGTLTLDLIAKIGGFTAPLDKAADSAKKNMNSISVATIAAGTALGEFAEKGLEKGLEVLKEFTIGSVDAAKEISNLSSLAGLSTTEFQKLAAGAATVGVSQEKLSDIFKDVNDKVGDFIATGGGQLKNFFTYIAPQVGVTADQFKKLNSADALGLYVTTLQKANVSQAEMTTYMEAIANDSTALVPLLKNNSAAFKELGQAAYDAGAIMDDSTIAAAKAFSGELTKLGQYVTAAKNSLAAEFLPVLAQFTKDIGEAAKANGGLGTTVKSLGDDLVDVTAFIASAADGVGRVFKITADLLVAIFSTALKDINLLAAGFNQALANITLGDLSARYQKDADAASDAAAQAAGVIDQAGDDIRQNLETPMAGDFFKQYVKNAKDAAKAAADATKTANTPGKGSGVDPKAIDAAAAAAKKLGDTFKDTETDYQRQIALINTSVDATKNATEVQKLDFEIQSGKLKGLNDLQSERLHGLAAELDAANKLKKANEDAAKARTFGAALQDTNQNAKDSNDLDLAGAGSGDKLKERLKADMAIRTDFAKQQSDLQKQLNDGSISQELYDNETQQLKDALADRIVAQQDYYNQQDDLQNNWINGVTSAWENYRDAATNYTQQAADATASILSDTTSAIADNIDLLITGQESVGDAVKNVVAGIAKSIISALEQMLAQWLVVQAVQLLFGKTTQAAAAGSMIANATATAAQASLAAFASTAAIPIVGPLAAPAAAAAATAFTLPLVAAVSSASLAGMAHDGIDAVPETGTWLLQKGERVTTAATSAKLDSTLDNIKTNPANSVGGSTTINLIEDASKAGTSQQRTGEQGEQMIDIFVADLLGDGRTKDAMSAKFGLRSVGT